MPAQPEIVVALHTEHIQSIEGNRSARPPSSPLNCELRCPALLARSDPRAALEPCERVGHREKAPKFRFAIDPEGDAARTIFPSPPNDSGFSRDLGTAREGPADNIELRGGDSIRPVDSAADPTYELNTSPAPRHFE